MRELLSKSNFDFGREQTKRDLRTQTAGESDQLIVKNQRVLVMVLNLEQPWRGCDTLDQSSLLLEKELNRQGEYESPTREDKYMKKKRDNMDKAWLPMLTPHNQESIPEEIGSSIRTQEVHEGRTLGK